MKRKNLQTNLREETFEQMKYIMSHYDMPKNRVFYLVIEKAIEEMYERIMGETKGNIKKEKEVKIEIEKSEKETRVFREEKKEKYSPIKTIVVREGKKLDSLQEEDWEWQKG